MAHLHPKLVIFMQYMENINKCLRNLPDFNLQNPRNIYATQLVVFLNPPDFRTNKRERNLRFLN
jgi:hypothetical protein